MNNNKVQPQDIDSEQSLIGSMMMSKDAAALVIGKIKPFHFYKKAHADIFTAIIELFNNNQPIDLITVANEMKKNKTLDEIGGRTYLIDIMDSVPTASNAMIYADIVIEKAMLRQLITAGSDIIRDSFDDAKQAGEVLDEAQKKITDLSKANIKDNFVPITDVIGDVFEQIQSTSDSDDKLIGIASGYPDLDELTSGFQKGDLIILAARPSVGKTTLALNLAQKMAIQKNQGIAIFSCEMPAEQLAMRLL